MNDAVHYIRRFAVRGRVGGFKAATLVDGDVYEDCSGFHHFQHLFGDEVRGFIARDEDGTYHEVYVGKLHPDVVHGGIECLHVLRHHFAEVAEAGEVDVRNQDFGTHAGGYLCGVGSYDATTQNKHPCGAYTCHATHQFSFSALGLFEEAGAYLGSHASRHFAHRGEQGQRAVFLLHGFVGDADATALYHGFGKYLIGGEVEIGKYHLPLFNQFVLGGDRFFHLYNHFSCGIRSFDGWQHFRTHCSVLFIRKTAVCTGRRLYIHCMTSFHQLGYSGRGHSYTVLVVFDFLRYSDNHNLTILIGG